MIIDNYYIHVSASLSLSFNLFIIIIFFFMTLIVLPSIACNFRNYPNATWKLNLF